MMLEVFIGDSKQGKLWVNAGQAMQLRRGKAFL
jgi:hypothetical protein